MNGNSAPPDAQPVRGVLISIDHGEKVIGLAICDASWIIARPLGLIERTTRDADFARISALIAKHHAVGLVVGHPVTPEGFKGASQARTVERWASRLAAAVNVPVYLWDETLSTFEAGQNLVEAGIIPQGRIDDEAAAIMLRSFIAAHLPDTALPRPIKER